MDFRTPRAIGSRIDEPFQQLVHGAGYDHCYVLNKREPDELSFAAKCVEPNSGRTLKVYTTEPGVQLYTANWSDGYAGWHGATFPRRAAVCFEAQHFPDTPNKGHYPSCVLKPGDTYSQTTIYKFGVEK
jgi:aldose 1-epimerase